MKHFISSWLVLALVACNVCNAFKILVVFPMPGKSHVILGDGVVRHLANAGHEITYITPVIKKTQPSNVKQIDVSDNFKALPENALNIKGIMHKEVSLEINNLLTMMVDIHNRTYHNPNVQALLRDTNQKFDLVIVEFMFSELYAGFGAIYDVPFVWMSTVEPHWMALRLVDEMPNPAYTSDTMSSSLPPFSFFERAKQLASQVIGSAMRHYIANQLELDVYGSLDPYFKIRGREPPVYEELKFSAALMLGNSHVSLGLPMSLPPIYKGVGGYHIDTNLALLPKDLQQLLDNAKHGVIYFSMGSNLKSKDFPDELKVGLLKMFGTLKQTVLWKFEEVLPNLPSNVKILSWAPQPSILAHPNCLVFITHGGLLSTTETVHYAKPIIGIPVFADQFVNVERAVKKGFAKRVDLSYTMADQLKVAIEEVLHDPSYSKKVKELSFIYHHRPALPGVELTHWVEHVIKTGGAPHLRSPALHVPFYQKAYLDLAALILVVIVIIRAALKRIFKRNPKKVKKN